MYALPHLKARGGGAIVNTSSISALATGYAPVAYSTAKAAVLHFSKLCAADLARHRIRVNAVVPGFIATLDLRQRLRPGPHGVAADGRHADRARRQPAARGPRRPARGHRRGRALPGQRRGRLRHRHARGGRRRHDGGHARLVGPGRRRGRCRRRWASRPRRCRRWRRPMHKRQLRQVRHRRARCIHLDDRRAARREGGVEMVLRLHAQQPRGGQVDAVVRKEGRVVGGQHGAGDDDADALHVEQRARAAMHASGPAASAPG